MSKLTKNDFSHVLFSRAQCPEPVVYDPTQPKPPFKPEQQQVVMDGVECGGTTQRRL